MPEQASARPEAARRTVGLRAVERRKTGLLPACLRPKAGFYETLGAAALSWQPSALLDAMHQAAIPDA